MTDLIVACSSAPIQGLHTCICLGKISAIKVNDIQIICILLWRMRMFKTFGPHPYLSINYLDFEIADSKWYFAKTNYKTIANSK